MNEYDYAVGRPYARWALTDKKYNYDSGVVITPFGIADVYMQGDERSRAHTRIDAVVDGRVHSHSWDKRYSRRYVVTLANRMLRALLNEGGVS
ncbi:MAG: hypothetical protein AAGI88_24410 [Pseudomonadota bacterium]